MGETCVEGLLLSGGKSWYCKPTKFRMDLNLLDLAVQHFLEGTEPTFSGNKCSLSRNLNVLLDQDGNGAFNIFDVDLAVLAFLEQPTCTKASGSHMCTAPNEDLVYCDANADCGKGLFCDAPRHACSRECGVIASREAGVSALDRPCTGFAQECDRERGQCVEVAEFRKITCQADSQCLPGTYCFLGQCAPSCFRASDCPDSGWTCSATNRCRPLPLPNVTAGFVFAPERYVVRFLRDELDLDAVRNSDRSGLAVLDLVTGKQVLNEPGVVFGYRLEATYGRKRDKRCISRTFVDCNDGSARPPSETVGQCLEIQADCDIDASSESWIRLVAPQGIVHTMGGATVEVALDAAIAALLSPGVYPAKVTAIFDNGGSDAIDVVLTKTSPSGSYAGTLTVGRSGGDVKLNAGRPMGLSLRMWVGDDTVKWTTLMDTHHIPNEQGSFIDLNTGLRVHALLDGDSAFGFARSGPGVAGTNDIPLVGIYQPDKKRIRMVGVIDVPGTFCRDEDDQDCANSPSANGKVRAKNPFGRRIRRQIEFAGPFEDATGAFHGTYIESISGLLDSVVTLEGQFALVQTVSDDSPIVLAPLFATTETPAQIALLNLSAQNALTAVGSIAACAGSDPAFSAATGLFEAQPSFSCYLSKAHRLTPVDTPSWPSAGQTAAAWCGAGASVPALFPGVDTFNSANIKAALGALQADGAKPTGDLPGDQAAYLNIFDAVGAQLSICDPSLQQPSPVCVNEGQALCGLGLYQRALASGWVSTASLSASGTKGAAGDRVLFCTDAVQLDPAMCPTSPGTSDASKALFIVQEHNRFWSALAQARKFTADRARSDGFLTLFRNQFNPFVKGTAREYKAEKLAAAMQGYDALVEQTVSTAPAWTLLNLPVRGFHGAGQEWIDLINIMLSDRMDVLTDLVDLRRRVFMTTNNNDFRFAKHLMQFEYLVQVFVMELQARWQQELFSYDGAAGRIFEKGQGILDQLRTTRNSIGVVPNRVFFENGDPGVQNWVAYRNQLIGSSGTGGLVGASQKLVADGIAQLKAAAADVAAVEAGLASANAGAQTTIKDTCGDDSILQPGKECDPAKPEYADQGALNACYCNYFFAKATTDDLKNLKKAVDCAVGGASGCPEGIQVNCPTESIVGTCSSAHNKLLIGLNHFIDTNGIVPATGGIPVSPMAAPPFCALSMNGTDQAILVNGKPRWCLGGTMRTKLQARAKTEIALRNVLTELNAMLRKINLGGQKFTLGQTTKQVKFVLDKLITIMDFAATKVNKAAVTVQETLIDAITATDCILVAGLAVGTDCPGSIISGVLKPVTRTVKEAVVQISDVFKFAAKLGVDVAKQAIDAAVDIGGEAFLRDQLLFDIIALIDKASALAQTEFEQDMDIGASRLAVQKAADGWAGSIKTAAALLRGQQSGSILMSQHLVGEASAGFKHIIEVAYKQAVAFVHAYNLSPAEALEVTNLALTCTTLDEVLDFAAVLDSKALNYCAVSGIDCDALGNIETLRLSLRTLLFPALRDRIDGTTVVTAGEQFHNAITSPPYLTRRVRGPYTADQIELPFAVDLLKTEGGPKGPQWSIDPFSCNQLLRASSGGNVAVTVVGKNLTANGESVYYQLQRGETDFIRGCGSENQQLDFGTDPILAYPVRKHIVAYPPANANNDKETVPEYFTRSGSFQACVASATDVSAAGGCYRMFARDRSLASPDWKLIIPVLVDGAGTKSQWVLGTGLKKEDRPIIEDVVVYFRYASRPVSEQ